MTPRAYKTSYRIWFALSLAIFLICFFGIDYVFQLFSGQLHLADFFRFAFIGPLFLSAVLGWLGQCAIVIVLNRPRNKPKQ